MHKAYWAVIAVKSESSEDASQIFLYHVVAEHFIPRAESPRCASYVICLHSASLYRRRHQHELHDGYVISTHQVLQSFCVGFNLVSSLNRMAFVVFFSMRVHLFLVLLVAVSTIVYHTDPYRQDRVMDMVQVWKYTVMPCIIPTNPASVDSQILDLIYGRKLEMWSTQCQQAWDQLNGEHLSFLYAIATWQSRNGALKFTCTSATHSSVTLGPSIVLLLVHIGFTMSALLTSASMRPPK